MGRSRGKGKEEGGKKRRYICYTHKRSSPLSLPPRWLQSGVDCWGWGKKFSVCIYEAGGGFLGLGVACPQRRWELVQEEGEKKKKIHVEATGN